MQLSEVRCNRMLHMAPIGFINEMDADILCFMVLASVIT